MLLRAQKVLCNCIVCVGICLVVDFRSLSTGVFGLGGVCWGVDELLVEM